MLIFPLSSALLRLLSRRGSSSKMMLHLISLLCVGLHATEQVIYSCKGSAPFLVSAPCIPTQHNCGLDPLQAHWWQLRRLHCDILPSIMWFWPRFKRHFQEELLNKQSTWHKHITFHFLLPSLRAICGSFLWSAVSCGWLKIEWSCGSVSLWLILSSAIERWLWKCKPDQQVTIKQKA